VFQAVLCPILLLQMFLLALLCPIGWTQFVQRRQL
jgi:hypothetical protein